MILVGALNTQPTDRDCELASAKDFKITIDYVKEPGRVVWPIGDLDRAQPVP